MESLNGGKAYRACISLEEYPWVRDKLPTLDTLVYGKWAYHICRGVDERIVGKMVLQTFVSTENERVILVLPRREDDVELLQRVIDGVDKYVKGLDEPLSCLVDPKTGKYPVEVDLDSTDFW